ncbi:MAG: hypothetical protein DME98_18330 [Verrucomicrobia bacterium]|nr:MAG: hypothetical protein DME98_18330 [Verrucomicrobiota bacterium]PYJ32798.1 MAG: hypothetical protein DME88_09895 [Verrucomicrobiota bacterium]
MPDDPTNFLSAEFSQELSKLEPSRQQRILRKLALAALGSIPWVGGFMAAIASIKEDDAQSGTDNLQRQWLEEHAKKIKELADTLSAMLQRLDSFGEEVKQRLESDEYLDLIRSGFRKWDEASTSEKKRLIANLLTNSGASRLTSDDVIRLFLDWIEMYHEIHFAVIREVYRKPGITRHTIWKTIHGVFPREDSAEADLFRMLIRDLSMGGVIRQHRETTYSGEFVARKPQRGTRASGVLKSAFDTEEPYELTELGRQFVHYTMEEVVPRVEG